MCNEINFNWCIYPWDHHHNQDNKRVYHPPRLPHAPSLDSIFNQGEYTHKVFPILPASESQIAKKSISEPYLAFIWTRWINTRNLLTMHSWEYKKSVFKLHLQRRHLPSKLYWSREVLDYLKDGNWKVSNHTLKGPWFSSLTGLQISQKLNLRKQQISDVGITASALPQTQWWRWNPNPEFYVGENTFPTGF